MKKWLYKVLAISLCVALALGMAACTPDQPQVEEKTVLNVPTVADVTQLDPHVSNGADAVTFSAIFDSLVKFDGGNQMAVKPCLARSWDISDDQLEYTFELVETNWHDGTPFTADDVVFSIERMIAQPATSSKVLMIEGAQALDEHTVKVTCKYAYPNLLLQMASWPWRMVSRNAVEAHGDGVKEMVVGTGPYKLESWTPGVGLTLTSNEDYFDGAPHFKTVNVKLITDASTTMVALENGEVDMATITSGPDADYIRNSEEFDLLEIKRSGAYTVIYNTSANEILGNQKVRQAITHAIDKDSLIDLVYDGEAYGDCHSIFSEGEEGYTEDIPKYDYDPERAKELLAEAGYPEGISIKFTYPTIERGERLAAALKDNLKKSGIELVPVPTEYSAYLAASFAGDYETIYMEWQSIPYNPPLVYNLYFISQGSLNYPRIKNEEIDRLAYQASQELDDAKRIELFEQLNYITRDQAYYATIGYVKSNIARSKHLKGMEFEPNTMITKFADWYWE